jgi:hypothetical protein
MPLSGGDRKALKKELARSGHDGNARPRFGDAGRQGRAPDQAGGQLACESWNERMWSAGEPIDPLPTIDQAINGGYVWLQIECSL